MRADLKEDKTKSNEFQGFAFSLRLPVGKSNGKIETTTLREKGTPRYEY
jgi:hypothetical protein